ncbi:unnamed protein product, partial [Polarella glacialis]
ASDSEMRQLILDSVTKALEGFNAVKQLNTASSLEDTGLSFTQRAALAPNNAEFGEAAQRAGSAAPSSQQGRSSDIDAKSVSSGSAAASAAMNPSLKSSLEEVFNAVKQTLAVSQPPRRDSSQDVQQRPAEQRPGSQRPAEQRTASQQLRQRSSASPDPARQLQDRLSTSANSANFHPQHRQPSTGPGPATQCCQQQASFVGSPMSPMNQSPQSASAPNGFRLAQQAAGRPMMQQQQQQGTMHRGAQSLQPGVGGSSGFHGMPPGQRPMVQSQDVWLQHTSAPARGQASHRVMSSRMHSSDGVPQAGGVPPGRQAAQSMRNRSADIFTGRPSGMYTQL